MRGRWLARAKSRSKLTANAIPLLEGALELASQGMLTSGDKTNREYVSTDVEIAPSVDPNLVKLLFDPQTAGGMLIAIPEDKAEDSPPRSQPALSPRAHHCPRAS